MGLEENYYDNIELLNNLLDLYVICYNHVPENQANTVNKKNQIEKNHIILIMEMILSTMNIWFDIIDFNEKSTNHRHFMDLIEIG